MAAATNLEIPVLDLSDLGEPGQPGDLGDPSRAARGLSQLDTACAEWGFFQIIGHEIDPVFRARAFDAMAGFFALPRAEKLAIERSASNPWGYYDRELTKRKRDLKEIFDFGPADRSGPFAGAEARWPASGDEFRETMWMLFHACERIAYRLLSGLSLNLGLDAHALDGYFGRDHTSFLRLNAYPIEPDATDHGAICGDAEAQLGIHPHTDAGALTVLLQDEHVGLEVRHDGAWIPIAPEPEALVINVGDVVQVWSNDRYAAPLHRVRGSRRHTRYSAPFFFNPAYAANYAPLQGKPRYRSINWGEFRAGRAAGDYADQGREIQIAHYRI